MARIRIFIVLVLALSAGGAFAYGTYRYIQNVPAQAEQMPTRPVVVATADLNIGDELRPEDVRIVEWPATSVPERSFDTAQEVLGRGVIVPVVKNEPVLATKLASKDLGAGLPPVIPDGMRAVSVRVNDVVGVAGYVLPGTRVDVVATVNPTREATDVTSKVVLSNVLVLTAGTKIDRDNEEGKPIAVSVVTLLVNPAEAERLTLASTEGKIQLALRNPLDKSAPTTPGIRPAALIGMPAVAARGSGGIRRQPAAVAAAPAQPTVEMIRGDKRVQEVVRQ